jgi:hypothetical protein
MAHSQNVRFAGKAPDGDELEHPRGSTIAILLRQQLGNKGWHVGEPDNWRDGGWSIVCSRSGSRLELVVCMTVDEGDWYLQIAAEYRPGIIGRFRGKPASASAADIFALAKDVHRILRMDGHFSDFKSCWDGYPEDDSSTSDPLEPGIGT